MSVGARTLGDLEKECAFLGLVPKASGKKLLKKDYIKVLRDHYLMQKYPDGSIPWHLQYMIDLETPMLCARMGDCKPHDQEYLWNGEGVVAQRKLDGVRMVVVYSQNEGVHLYSRNISVTDYSPQDYAPNVALPDFRPATLTAFGVRSFILDCEVICPRARVNTLRDSMEKKGVVTATVLQAVAALLQLNPEDSTAVQTEQGIQLEFHAFHLLMYNGEDFRDAPLHRVLPELTKVIDLITPSGFPVKHVPVVHEGRKAYYDSIVTTGGEGVILKRLSSTYKATESRAHREWVKAKISVSQSMLNAGMGDTVDAFVTGWGRGDEDTTFKDMVGYLKWSVWLLKEDGSKELHEIAHTPNLTLEERKKISVIGPDGQLTLDPSYMGRVGVLDGQGISARARRLTHPKLVEWRMGDKQPEACVMEESLLNKLIGTDNAAGKAPLGVVGESAALPTAEVGF
jgi:hypothetical protein